MELRPLCIQASAGPLSSIPRPFCSFFFFFGCTCLSDVSLLLNKANPHGTHAKSLWFYRATLTLVCLDHHHSELEFSPSNLRLNCWALCVTHVLFIKRESRADNSCGPQPAAHSPPRAVFTRPEVMRTDLVKASVSAPPLAIVEFRKGKRASSPWPHRLN